MSLSRAVGCPEDSFAATLPSLALLHFMGHFRARFRPWVLISIGICSDTVLRAITDRLLPLWVSEPQSSSSLGDPKAEARITELGRLYHELTPSYYHGMEGVGSTRDELDGYDMRKSMPKDTKGEYVRENGKEVLVTPDQVWA